MTRFVAFLRGINVGGNVIKKEKLYDIFVSLGFANVSTCKQSGNVIFDTNAVDSKAIREKIQQKINQLIGKNIPVFLRTINQLEEIVKTNPFKNVVNVEGTSFLVTFMSDNMPLTSLRLKPP